jgi:hypothetical protein
MIEHSTGTSTEPCVDAGASTEVDHWTVQIGQQPDRSTRERLEPESHVASPPRPRDWRPCRSTLPGHQMHWLAREQAAHTPAIPVMQLEAHGIDLRLTLEDGRTLFWRHHAPARIAAAVDARLGGVVAYVQHTTLRIGPAWFNCAEAGWPWQECRRFTR